MCIPSQASSGEPRFELAELARLDARLQDRLDAPLVLTAPPAELLRPLPGEGGELVQEDPDVVRVAMDHVEQLVAVEGDLHGWRTPCLGHPVRPRHHLVHHPIVDGGEQLLLRADVVVQRTLAQVVGGAELGDAGRVVAPLGEDAGGGVDDRLATDLPVRPAP